MIFEEASYRKPSFLRVCVRRAASAMSIPRALATSVAGAHGLVRRYFSMATRARRSVQDPILGMARLDVWWRTSSRFRPTGGS